MSEENTAAEPTSLPKLDPETLVLRGSPRRVVRFRRGAIIALAGSCSIGIAAITWIALKPASFSMVAAGDDSPQAGVKLPPEAVAKAPGSYGDIPRLGPPLPGDLGRPILKQQRKLDAASAPIDQAAAEASNALKAAEAERQRAEAERTAARQSGVLMQLANARPLQSTASFNADSSPNASSPLELTPTSRLAPDPMRDLGDQQNKADILNRIDRGDDISEGDINPHGLQQAVSPWTLTSGSVIAASLVTGLNSDLPGLVVAQVTENAHDSVTGRTLLLPQGSRLIGSYDSVVAFGQRRALLVWHRIILPDGSSIRIDNVPATDAAGHAGLADKVDFHTWSLIKGVALSTLLGVGTELTFSSGESDLIRAIRESIQQNSDRAGQQIVAKNLNIQPTITVRPGWPLRIVVHKDIVLRPWKMR